MELTIKNLSKEYGKKKAVRCFNATLTNGGLRYAAPFPDSQGPALKV